jgi:hypothetical protein
MSKSRDFLNVEKILPEYNQRVLVNLAIKEADHLPVVNKTYIGRRETTDKDGDWFKLENYYRGTYLATREVKSWGVITDWMPLPEID